MREPLVIQQKCRHDDFLKGGPSKSVLKKARHQMGLMVIFSIEHWRDVEFDWENEMMRSERDVEFDWALRVKMNRRNKYEEDLPKYESDSNRVNMSIY